MISSCISWLFYLPLCVTESARSELIHDDMFDALDVAIRQLVVHFVLLLSEFVLFLQGLLAGLVAIAHDFQAVSYSYLSVL